MRLYAAIATLVSVVAIAAAGSTALADTANNTNTTNSKSTPAQILVTVQPGDYLSAIAGKYDTTYVRIFDANTQISNPDLIYPGEVLRIPGASEQLPDRALPTVSAAPEVQQPAPAPVTVPANDTASNDASNQSVVQAPAVSSGSVWDQIAQCESSGNWSADTGNGFYGGLQFTLSSWDSVGGSGYPNQASRDEQIMRAEALQAQQGWGAWPVCSAKLGL